LETIKSVTPLFPSKTGNYGAIILFTSRVPVVRHGRDNAAVGRRATREFRAIYLKFAVCEKPKYAYRTLFVKNMIRNDSLNYN